MITLTTAGSTTGTKFITPSITLLWEIVSKAFDIWLKMIRISLEDFLGRQSEQSESFKIDGLFFI